MGPPLSVAVAEAVEPRGRTAFEVADVVRAYGAEFLRTHPTSREQRRVLRAIARCRELLHGPPAAPAVPPTPDASAAPDRVPRCPRCGGLLRRLEVLAPQSYDTS